jgi:GTP-binding protein
MQQISTPKLVRALQDAVIQHPPPIVKGRRIKLRYAHQGGRNPPMIVVHGTQTESLPESYQRYLSKTFREAFKLVGTPVQIELKSSANPYQGKPKKNTLTPRQIHKKRMNQRNFRKK